jgi:aspartate aminotransferase-like enzyme
MANTLRIPGPTPVPPEVLAALSKPMISHRSPEFRRLLATITERLERVLGTANEVLLLTASGTGGLEAAVANTISPGDPVLAVSIGHFGERFAEIAASYGAELDYLRSTPGQVADPREVARAVAAKPYRAVLVTHCETSTGALNDLAALSAALGAATERPLLLVDGVSSLAGVPLGLADDGYDVAVTASQKAWMCPPGLCMVAVSSRGWERIETCRSPRTYLDLRAARRFAKRGETPWTPAITLLYGLDVALDMLLAEGMATVYARHERLARRFREGLRAIGLAPLAAEEHASPTVTAALLPDGMRSATLIERLRTEHGIEVADGQDGLKGRALRAGHMGYVSEGGIQALLTALSAVIEAGGREATLA